MGVSKRRKHLADQEVSRLERVTVARRVKVAQVERLEMGPQRDSELRRRRSAVAKAERLLAVARDRRMDALRRGGA